MWWKAHKKLVEELRLKQTTEPDKFHSIRNNKIVSFVECRGESWDWLKLVFTILTYLNLNIIVDFDLEGTINFAANTCRWCQCVFQDYHYFELNKLIRYYTNQNVTNGWLLIGDDWRKLEVWKPKYCVETGNIIERSGLNIICFARNARI